MFLCTFERIKKSSLLVYYLVRILRIIFFRLFFTVILRHSEVFCLFPIFFKTKSFSLFYGNITRQIIIIVLRFLEFFELLSEYINDFFSIYGDFLVFLSLFSFIFFNEFSAFFLGFLRFFLLLFDFFQELLQFFFIMFFLIRGDFF